MARSNTLKIVLLTLSWCLQVHFRVSSATTSPPVRVMIVPVSTPPNLTSSAKDEWWTEDHPYMYQYRYKRLANGSIVLNEDANNNSSEKVTLKAIRDAAAANRSGITAFLASSENRKAIRKVSQFVLMNFVPPVAHGSLMKQMRIKKLQSKMVTNYFVRSIAIPGVKLFGTLVLSAIKQRYGGYIKRQMFFKRMATMSLAELCAELNITAPVYDEEAYFEAHRPNYTLPYEPKGYVHSFRADALQFEPYANYARIYYSPDDDLPAPVLPAPSYPWRWRRELAETRDLVLQVMALTADVQQQEIAQLLKDDDDVSNSTGSSPAGKTERQGEELASFDDLDSRGGSRERKLASRPESTSGSTTDSIDDDSPDAAETEFETSQEIESILSEYHVASGIPRIALENHTNVLFPTLESLLLKANTTTAPALARNATRTDALGVIRREMRSEPDAATSRSLNERRRRKDARVVGTDAYRSAPSLSPAVKNASIVALDPARAAELRRRKAVLYDAMVQFYAFPSVDASIVRNSSNRTLAHSSGVINCSVAVPCLVQSSVTVFTPQLCTSGFFHRVVSNRTVSKEQQRRARLQLLESLVDVAFEAELRALRAGIQAPSTVWLSRYDLQVDQFADALQGRVNATWHRKTGGGGTATALAVYTSLVSDRQRSLFYSLPSYYWTTLRGTRRAMEALQTVPMLAPLSPVEQNALVTRIAARMTQLDAAVAAFMAARAADREYRDVVNATVSRAEYEGSQYSTLGFGFVLPATNRQNVLYRDLRRPEPLHLALRLMVRAQESCLLLVDESLHIVACLAMLRTEIAYYRCRST